MIDAAVDALLDGNDLALFDQLGTSNFEESLRAVDFVSVMMEQLNHDQTVVLQRRPRRLAS